jgi:hypothetical protein
MFSGLRVQVLVLRVIMGLGFAFLLSRFFFPRASLTIILVLAALLVLAAYGMEIVHRGKR